MKYRVLDIAIGLGLLANAALIVVAASQGEYALVLFGREIPWTAPAGLIAGGGLRYLMTEQP